jgi:hypothetical protein
MNSLWDFLNMMVFGFKWVVNHLAQFFLFLFSYVIAMPKSMYVFTVVWADVCGWGLGCTLLRMVVFL